MKLFNFKEKTGRLILTALCGAGLVVTGLLTGLAMAGKGAVHGETPAGENTQLSAEGTEEAPPQTATDTDTVDEGSAQAHEYGGGEDAEVYAANSATYVLVLENEGMLVIRERDAASGADTKLMELMFETEELDDAQREELSLGMEFETLSEIDEYLESAES